MPPNSQRPSTATPKATGTATTSSTLTPTSVAASATPTQEATEDGIADRILPSPEDLSLPEEEQELICDHIIPWLDNHAFTLSNDGTFYSDSIIPPIVQQWLIGRGARLATTPPAADPTTTVFTAPRGARPAAAPPSVAPPSRRPDEDTKRHVKKAKSSNKKSATKKEPANEDDEDKKMPARPNTQPPGTGTTPSTRPTTSHNRSPWSVHLTGPTGPAQEGTPNDIGSPTATLSADEDAWLRNHIIPWLSNNNITLNEDGSYHSNSTIPPLVQQWLNLATYRHLTQEDYATGFRHLQTTSVGPPHVDHPAFSPRKNEVMREEGLQIVGNRIYAPQGFNKYLLKFWEKKLATGELYREPTPPPTSSDDSDSTPPKRNQKKQVLARKKTPNKRPKTTSEPPVAIRTLSASTEFTGPPPHATPAEVDQWVALWFRYHPTRTTPEGIVQCLAPGHTTPPWVQTWVNNARQVAEANTPDINTGEDQPAPPAAAAAHTAPPQDEIDDAIEAAASAWLSSNVIHINGKFHCVDPDQVVPQYVHDWMDHIRAQIGTMKQENHPAS